MNSVIPFDFRGHSVRVIDIDHDPWFVAKDVAENLGYRNTSKAINAHCKAVRTCPTEMGGQVRHVQFIPERDVYRLVMRSKLPAAEEFEEWVVGEVLPSIRKSGSYQVGGVSLPDFSNPAEAARAWADQHERIGIQSDKIEKLENFFQQGMTLTAFGKMLNGVNCMQMASFVADELNWLYNESRSGNNTRWRVRCTARDKYLTENSREIGVHGSDNLIRYEPKLLKKGAQKLYDLYLQGKLPMKKTWDGEYVHLKFEGEAA